MKNIQYKTVLKNTGYILISEKFSSIINFFQVIILTRYFGKSDYGIWGTVRALPETVLIISELGINSILLRKIANKTENNNDILNQVLTIKIVLSIFYISVILLTINYFNYDINVKTFTLIASIAILCGGFNQVIMSIYRANENFIYESVYKIVLSILFLSIVIFVALNNYKIKGVIYGFFIINFFGVLFVYVFYFYFHNIKIKFFNISKYLYLLRDSIPFAMLNAVTPVFMNIDIIMLSKMSTFNSIGIYNAAYRIIIFLLIVPFALKRALFPNLSRLYEPNKFENDLFKKSFLNSYRIIMLLGVPISIGIFILSEKIILMLFTKEFYESIVPLKIFSIMLIFHYFRSVYSVALYASKYEIQAVSVLIFSTVLNILLDYFLIPKYDYIGACFATLISEIMICIGVFYYVQKKLVINKLYFQTVKIFVSSIIMGMILILLEKQNIILQIILGVVIYIITIYIFKILNNEEIKDIKLLIKLSK